MTELLSLPSLSPLSLLQLRPWRRPSLHKERPRGAATPSAAQLEAVSPRPRTELVRTLRGERKARHYNKPKGKRKEKERENENGKIAHGRVKTNCRTYIARAALVFSPGVRKRDSRNLDPISLWKRVTSAIYFGVQLRWDGTGSGNERRPSVCLFALSRSFSAFFRCRRSLHPGDLYPFTRRPLFLIVDSDNSGAFACVPRGFDQPVVVLMSPQETPAAFQGTIGKIDRCEMGRFVCLVLV